MIITTTTTTVIIIIIICGGGGGGSRSDWGKRFQNAKIARRPKNIASVS
jgi:hypothetical protein